jgi:hypothetical protein
MRHPSKSARPSSAGSHHFSLHGPDVLVLLLLELQETGPVHARDLLRSRPAHAIRVMYVCIHVHIDVCVYACMQDDRAYAHPQSSADLDSIA